jgi:tRNA A37 threonylcarbamoyladenosine dehydratase
MDQWLSRTELLIGSDNIARLSSSHILIAGLGGVGGYAAEQLCRAGIGEFTLIDGDVVNASNRNRQIIALKSNEGRSKAELMSERLTDINPDVKIRIIPEFIKEDRFASIMKQHYDYVVDAIDTLTPKVFLLAEAVKNNHHIISSMGAGGKLDPSLVEVTDIADSHHCKFAYMVRKYLHRQGITTGIKVVFSPEPVKKQSIRETSGEENKRSVVGTISYMPPLFGCLCASVVIRDLISAQ